METKNKTNIPSKRAMFAKYNMPDKNMIVVAGTKMECDSRRIPKSLKKRIDKSQFDFMLRELFVKNAPAGLRKLVADRVFYATGERIDTNDSRIDVLLNRIYELEVHRESYNRDIFGKFDRCVHVGESYSRAGGDHYGFEISLKSWVSESYAQVGFKGGNHHDSIDAAVCYFGNHSWQ